jgi:hypothetical protein
LRWSEENASNIDQLREEIEDEEIGEARRFIAERELGEIMATQPEADAAVMLCVTAWVDLQADRQIGMEVGAIPWTAVAAWCEFHSDKLDRVAAEQLMEVIRKLESDRSKREAIKRTLGQIAGGPR